MKKYLFHLAASGRKRLPRLISEKGMTLTELIVAAILVSIVLAGAIATDYAVRRLQQQASKDATLAMKTSATMMQIVRDAEKAVGNYDNSCMSPALCGPGMVDLTTSFCFRQDNNTPKTPDNYADDQWVCYWKDDEIVYRCAELTMPYPSCPPNTPQVGTVIPGLAKIHDIKVDPTNGIYIDITLTNRSDPLAAMDPMDNPEITLQTRVYPLEHSY